LGIDARKGWFQMSVPKQLPLFRGGKKPDRDAQWRKIYNDADAAGKAAVAKLNVVPMIVGSPPDNDPLSDRIDPTKKTYFVADGVCGFAWISINPGNSPFANYCKRIGVAKKGGAGSGMGGAYIWVSDYTQSLQKKEAYANAFAKSCRDAGINRVYASSRMD
jgi:hypothetical protein